MTPFVLLVLIAQVALQFRYRVQVARFVRCRLHFLLLVLTVIVVLLPHLRRLIVKLESTVPQDVSTLLSHSFARLAFIVH